MTTWLCQCGMTNSVADSPIVCAGARCGRAQPIREPAKDAGTVQVRFKCAHCRAAWLFAMVRHETDTTGVVMVPFGAPSGQGISYAVRAFSDVHLGCKKRSATQGRAAVPARTQGAKVTLKKIETGGFPVASDGTCLQALGEYIVVNVVWDPAEVRAAADPFSTTMYPPAPLRGEVVSYGCDVPQRFMEAIGPEASGRIVHFPAERSSCLRVPLATGTNLRTVHMSDVLCAEFK